ncbi:uncharacterized protein LOC105215721 isoform X2 [Zeugodacus cucurbitae]|uniref:uncharacterized protein LOC105215721 isoform X2 n=1 Tax=Zeugodacus cucurbitae TaxID=28588 RepID=UPI0023D941D3|nr:uncharacterized protein LOC105215721 isoform X2 [Zeugodacus cucurbitae]
MNKKTFSNLLSKEESKFEASATKFRKLNESVREVSNKTFDMHDLGNSDHISNVSGVSSSSSGSQTEIIQKMVAMETRQKEILKFLRSVEGRLTGIEKSLKDNMPDKAEVQAQNKLLRECHVEVSKTQRSLSRITGDLEDEEYTELASELPMTSEVDVRFIEEKLLKKESTEMRIMMNAKGFKGNIDGVLRRLFSDDLMYHYNLEGRNNKKTLLKLKSAGLIFDIFPDMDKNAICEEIRRYVVLSHNRYNQKKYKLKAELE